MPFVLSSSSSLAVQLHMAQDYYLVAQEQAVDIQAACLIWSMADRMFSQICTQIS
jgi:hypothetical protein